MQKKLLFSLTIVCLLALLLSACGKKKGDFQGTITDVSGSIVTITPDPGAKILEEASSVTFDCSQLEDLEAKADDSVYVVYDSVTSSKSEGTSIHVTQWQMLIRAPQNDPDSAQLMQTDTDKAATVTAEDGAFVCKTVLEAPYAETEEKKELPFTIRIGGSNYTADCYLQECIWYCTLCHDGQSATLKAADAMRLASIFQANGFEIADWVSVTAMSEEKAAITDLNLRCVPSTQADILTSVTATTKLNVIGQTSDGWYQVQYNDAVVYANADYVK